MQQQDEYTAGLSLYSYSQQKTLRPRIDSQIDGFHPEESDRNDFPTSPAEYSLSCISVREEEERAGPQTCP